MGPHKREDREKIASPCQTWLTAYVDGELTDEERARVEAWLTRNPEVRAEVEAQQHLKALCERCPVPGPDALAWDDVLARVESALEAASTENLQPRLRPLRPSPPQSVALGRLGCGGSGPSAGALAWPSACPTR